MADDSANTTDTGNSETRVPLAACDFTIFPDATINEYLSAVAQMFNATRLMAAELMRTGAVTPANPIMQHLMGGAAGLETALAIAQQQAQQAQAQSRIMAPTLQMRPGPGGRTM